MEAKLEQVEHRQMQAETLLEEVAAALKRDIPAVFKAKTMEAPKLAPITAGKDELLCPKCRAGLLAMKAGQAFYGCSRYREGCSFTLNPVVAKKTLTAAQVKALVGKGRTALIKGFKSREGKPFDAALVLRAGKVEFEFPR
jgi:DNA topoisomerase-3